NASRRNRTLRVPEPEERALDHVGGEPDLLGWSAEGFGRDVPVHLRTVHGAVRAAGRRDRLDGLDSRPTGRAAQRRRLHHAGDDTEQRLRVPRAQPLNEARAPWHDVRVRKAIAYAIDRDAIVQATSYGTAVANQLAIPKGNPWYTPYDTYRHDIERAKGLLRDAGAAPKTLDMLVTTEYPETVTAAQIIADNLAPLGITVNIRTVDFATWLDEQKYGNFDMLMMGWLGNIDPDDFYYAQHHSRGSSNAQKFSNAEVDRLLDAGRVET